MISVEYKIAPAGLGSDFTESERPITFASVYENRFRNVTGGAERRPGMLKYNQDAISGSPNLTRLHEHVSNLGVETLLTSDDLGSIWRFDASASANLALDNKAQARMISAQVGDKLIFVNGQDRNFYTTDGGQTFNELLAVINRGELATGSSAAGLVDSNITNWISDTLVANNDIVWNITKNAYGIVTTVATAKLTHTAMGPTGVGIGFSTSPPEAGDQYVLIDYVDMNLIPKGEGNFDNVALIAETSGPFGTEISVSAISNWSQTEIKIGDIIYNTTRSGLMQVSYIQGTVNNRFLGVVGIGGMTTGDSLVFLKSAMPIASWIHNHYGRTYFIDSRNNKNVVITAPDDAEDVTTYQKTLDSSSFSFGSTQPQADSLLTLGTFLSYFVAAGKRMLYLYKGDTPIQDASGTSIDFEPVAAYPNGVYSRFGLTTDGTILFHLTRDGLQAISVGSDSNSTLQNNASQAIRNELSNNIAINGENDVQLTFYPRRSWRINKVGSQAYILNTAPSFSDLGQLESRVSWHKFTGKWAQQNHYFVRRNGDLLACGPQGRVYYMDSSASTDDGEIIETDLTTAWFRLEEPQRTARVKQGFFGRLVSESSPQVNYNIEAVAGLDNLSQDSIVVSGAANGAIGSFQVGVTPIGAGIYAQDQKFPLRWRGEQVRVRITSETSASPDIISSLTLYGEIGGRR